MKKTLSVFIMIATLLCLAVGCNSSKDRAIYNVKLSKYVKLGDYKGIKVDTSSDEYKEYYDEQISADVSSGNFYVRKEGTVQSGDTVNIDYVGKKDGIAFEGGTAQGTDLEIGSGSFIDGFEDGLIGVETGKTVDLNLTFPESYQNTELAGAAVVFTVTVNYIATEEPLAVAEYFETLGFASEEEYIADVNKRAAKEFLIEKIVSDSEIKEYPAEDTDALLDAIIDFYDAQYQSYYNVDFETVLSSNGTTLDAFKSQMRENSLPTTMDRQMVLYNILDEVELTVSEEEIKNQNIDNTLLAETLAVEDKVADYLYENALIK